MGLMRFLVHDRHVLGGDGALARVYMSGLEEIPWRCRVAWDNGLLVIEREESDSGNVHVPWPCGASGLMMLTTACLMERERPYLLEVELARGTLNTIRNQIATWRQMGLILSTALDEQLAASGRRFAQAATCQHEPATAAAHAGEAIALAVQVGRELGVTYTQQALGVRRQQTPKLTTLLATNLGSRSFNDSIAKSIVETFHTGVVPIGWRQLEIGEGRRDWTATDQQIQWCQRSGLKVCAGPLLQMDATGIPDWIYLWEGDFDNLLTCMLDHVRAVVGRYRGKVQLWQVAGRVNCGKFLGLSEEQRLRTVVRAVDAVREIDQRTPLVVCFDQPWGEYLAGQEMDLAPIHFADALARSNLGLSGLGLEINSGYFPGGTLPHSMLDFSRHLDRWSTLGLPLMITLTAPSSGAADPHAALGVQPLDRAAGEPPTPQSQSDWAADFLPLMLSKNCVQVICWNQLRDAAPHDLPHGGLFDADDHPKPLLSTLRALRRMYLS